MSKPKQKKHRIIALEEHYWDDEVATHFGAAVHQGHAGELRERLFDLGELRLRAMDQAGIDVQVLSHGGPALHRIERAAAVPLAKRANDRLHKFVQTNP